MEEGPSKLKQGHRSNKAKGDQLETDVESMLSLMGYRVMRNELVRGTQIDLVAYKHGDITNTRVLVECANRSEPVGVALVKEKQSILKDHKPGYITTLLIVSATGFTAQARAFAIDDPHLTLMTPVELERTLVDFEPYAHWFVHNFEASAGLFAESHLFGRYVEVSARDECDRLIPMLSIEIEQWAQHSDNNILFLLGEYGSGKTSFCRHYTYSQLYRHFFLRQSGIHIPILVNLREYRTAVNLRQVLTDTLVNLYGVRLPSFLAFERVCSSQTIMLVLDGFDEMANRADDQTIIDCFNQIYLLAALNVKTLLTCRSNFFRSNQHVIDLLKQFKVGIRANDSPDSETIFLTDFSSHGRVIDIEKLTNDQIHEYIQKKCGSSANMVLRDIASVHDLSDLAKRPVLLDMIIATLPTLVQNGSTVNSATLYHTYIARWSKRDEWRATLPLDVREQFCDILAWTMYTANIQSVPIASLREIVLRVLGQVATTNEDLEKFHNDIQTCSFLVRADRSENFQFAHKSFMEFLISRQLIKTLVDGSERIVLPASANKAHDGKYVSAPTSKGTSRDSSIWSSLMGKSPRFIEPSFLMSDSLIERVLGSLPAFDSVVPTPAQDAFSTKYSELCDRLGRIERYMTISFGGETKVKALRTAVTSEMKHVVRSYFKSVNSGGLKSSNTGSLTEEIATFATECAVNLNISLKQLIDGAVLGGNEMILADMVQKSRSRVLLQQSLGFAKEYLLSGASVEMRQYLCQLLARELEVIDPAFVDEARKRMPPSLFSLLVFEMATHKKSNGSSIQYLLDLRDLRPVDCTILQICVAPPDASRPSNGDLLGDLLLSADQFERELGMFLCSSKDLSEIELAEALLKTLAAEPSQEVAQFAIDTLSLMRRKETSLLIEQSMARLDAKLRKKIAGVLDRISSRRAQELASEWRRGEPADKYRDSLWKAFGDWAFFQPS